MKRRQGVPWMAADAYAHSLSGLTVNLLVHQIDAALDFHERVLMVKTIYSDPDFAVVRGYDAEWILHADHTYDEHPARKRLQAFPQRGGALELRLHGCDPDAAARRAQALGYEVIQTPTDKAHGLRETYLVDSDGYLWVPDMPVGSVSKHDHGV
jgi:uncharacterized glyoxalase superfamily protein PhnB